MVKLSNPVAFVISLAVAVAWVEICKVLAHGGYLLPWQRRKLLHIFTGPLFIMTWPLFTGDTNGAVWAALVPFTMTLKFVAVGMGWLKDDDMVLSASRNNNRADLLKGPTLYGIIFVLTTLFYWKAVQAVLCLFILCFGDGFAEIIGRSFGANNRLPHSPDKSFAGLLGFILTATLSTLFFLKFYGDHLFGYGWETETVSLELRVFVDCIVAALVESLPFGDIDNITVFLAAVVFDELVMVRLLK